MRGLQYLTQSTKVAGSDPAPATKRPWHSLSTAGSFRAHNAKDAGPGPAPATRKTLGSSTSLDGSLAFGYVTYSDAVPVPRHSQLAYRPFVDEISEETTFPAHHGRILADENIPEASLGSNSPSIVVLPTSPLDI